MVEPQGSRPAAMAWPEVEAHHSALQTGNQTLNKLHGAMVLHFAWSYHMLWAFCVDCSQHHHSFVRWTVERDEMRNAKSYQGDVWHCSTGIAGEERTAWHRFKRRWLTMKMLIWWTLLGVGFGIILGVSLYKSHPTPVAVTLIGQCRSSFFLLFKYYCGRPSYWIYANIQHVLIFDFVQPVLVQNSSNMRWMKCHRVAGYPGELLIRALQELVLPLMVFALMSGVFNLRHSSSG